MLDFVKKELINMTIGDFMILCIYVKIIFSINFKFLEIDFTDKE